MKPVLLTVLAAALSAIAWTAQAQDTAAEALAPPTVLIGDDQRADVSVTDAASSNSEPTEASAAAPAETRASEDGTVTLDVRAEEAVDPEALREALERDLGVRVELVREGGARVVVDMLNDGRVRLRVRREEDELTRDTPAEGDPAQTATAVSLMISNLVRDESGEVLAILRIQPDGQPELAEEPQAEPEPEPVVTAPEAPEPPEVPPAPAAPEPQPRIGFGIDFAPGVGFSSAFGGQERRNVSFGVVGALHGGLDGFGGSGVLDLGLGDVRGGQLAGVLALSTGEVRGVQGSGVAAIAGDVRGLQIASSFALAVGDVEGTQGSVISITTGAVRGAQLGVTNVAGAGVDGAQLGVANIAAETTRGVQLGVTNIAGEVYGAQLGLVNIAAGPVHGVQVGLVNVAERADAQIGLVGVNARGRTQLRLGLDTNGFIDANLVHGGEYTHMIVRFGVLPFLDRPTVAAGLGFGGRIPVSDLLHIDIELTTSVLLDETASRRSPDMLHEARVIAGIPLLDGFGIYAGLAYRLHQTIAPTEVEIGAPGDLEHELASNGGFLLRGWPSILAGVELF